MRLPANRVTPRYRTATRRTVPPALYGLALLLTVGAHEALASTMHHRYSFETSQLEIIESASEIALHAGSLPRTWEKGQPEIPGHNELSSFLSRRGQ